MVFLIGNFGRLMAEAERSTPAGWPIAAFPVYIVRSKMYLCNFPSEFPPSEIPKMSNYMETYHRHRTSYFLNYHDQILQNL